MKAVKVWQTWVIEYKNKHRIVYMTSVMLLFWSIFDGLITYITPLLITGDGYSTSVMGVIYGSSPLSGAIFDLILVRVVKNSHFRRLYLLMFAVCFIYPLVLWHAKSIPLYLIVMALWGIYFDLKNIATYDLVSRATDADQHLAGFTITGFFRVVGYLSVPIIAGLIITRQEYSIPIFVALIFLTLSFLFFLILLRQHGKVENLRESSVEGSLVKRDTLSEMKLIWKITQIFMPLLLFTLYINLFDAFFWTLGPLYTLGTNFSDQFEGLFMVAYLLPPMLIYWFVGSVAKKYGKKRTAFFSVGIASIILILFWFEPTDTKALLLVLIISLFSSVATPALDGAIGDYLSESELYDKEVNTLFDLFMNIGWIVGPPLAGILADIISIEKSFAILGIIGVMLTFSLSILTPNKIDLESRLRVW